MKKSHAYSNRRHLVMNTSAHIAKLIGHMHGLKPNQASPCFSVALVSELIGIPENNQAGITCRKSHALIVFGQFKS